jgi:hypothetical protein
MTDPVFTMSGRINIIPKDDIKSVRINIAGKSGIVEVPINDKGIFTFTAKDNFDYSVKITLPFERDITVNNLGAEIFSNAATTFEYKAAFSPNACDVRNIGIFEPQKENAGIVKAFLDSGKRFSLLQMPSASCLGE